LHLVFEERTWVVRVFLVVQFAYFQGGIVARCEGSFHLCGDGSIFEDDPERIPTVRKQKNHSLAKHIRFRDIYRL
jgi:hypothetical protein